MIDARSRRLKDVSHEGSRWLALAEIERILSVSKEALGADLGSSGRPASPGETARLHLAASDTDGSGMLDGDELVRAGGRGMDLDGDGRVRLIELARAADVQDEPGEETTAPPAEAPTPFMAPRVQPDGVLARLLDGVDPYRHDRDQDGGLSRAEVEHAFFEALDLDGDQELTRDELSRYPGELRDLRHGDALSRAAFERVDRNRDGHVSPREFRLADPEWTALDRDGDGSVRLLAPPLAVQRERGLVLEGSEWPARRTDIVLLPPGIDVAAVLEEFDRDADEVLDQRELERRPDLVQRMDGNRDRRVERAEIALLLARLQDEGVQSLPDDFLGRWDLDGSGTVETDELPASVRARLRSE
jgi:Ca2+-binding EF-hand superfamily protein